MINNFDFESYSESDWAEFLEYIKGIDLEDPYAALPPEDAGCRPGFLDLTPEEMQQVEELIAKFMVTGVLPVHPGLKSIYELPPCDEVKCSQMRVKRSNGEQPLKASSIKKDQRK